MRTFVTPLRFALLFLVLNVATAFSAGVPVLKDPASGGLSVSLNLSGFRFIQPSDPTAGIAVGEPSPSPFPDPGASFVASIALQNRSRAPIAFTFSDAGPRWTFHILDSDGNEVWASDSDLVSAQMITQDTLPPRKTWKSVARIPLVIDGAPLAPGIYTLQAVLNADKPVSASSFFEVVLPAGADTGIRGTVTGDFPTVIFSELPADSTWGPVPNAFVTVQELITDATANRTPFSWSGYTDSNGKFSVITPPGKFRVTASRFHLYPIGPFVPLSTTSLSAGTIIVGPLPKATADVTVTQGSFSEVALELSQTPPPITQGIKGTVQPISYPTTTPGLARLWYSFSVSITQLDASPGTAPYVWTGSTDSLGRFQAATPTGRFRVTAFDFLNSWMTQSIPGSVYIPSVATEVTVEANAVTTVSLSFDSPTVVLAPQ